MVGDPDRSERSRVDEDRAHRRAAKLGFRLESGRAEMPTPSDHGLYRLIDDRGVVVAGACYEATLAEIQERLHREDRRLRGFFSCE